MYDPSLVLAAWLAAALQGYATTVWSWISGLAGGPQSPLWRWVLVEQGLFLLHLFLGAWWVRLVLGLGGRRPTPQHWGAAAVCACAFSLLWSWYGLLVGQAVQLGLHPLYGWEWAFFTWGLLLLVVAGLFPALPFLTQFGLAIALGAVPLLVLGRLWAGAKGLPVRQVGGRRRP